MRTGWTVPALWKGERCFIIAGGPSVPRLKIFLSTLRGKVIAIKDAAFLQPTADLWFYAGRSFHQERPDVWAAYRGQMRVKRTVDRKGVPEGVLQVHRSGAGKDGLNGFQEDPQLIGGFCCGGSALNLAVHLGAREVVLVGYDLTGHHWNARHPYPAAKTSEHRRHRLSIDAMASPIARRGVKVWNTSAMSTLQEFEYADLDNFL